MPTIPKLTPVAEADPHVFILGAGASLAACPEGDRDGRVVPVMKNLVEVVGLDRMLADAGIDYEGRDFEAVYDALAASGEHTDLVRDVERQVENYFAALQLPDRPTVYDYLLLSLRPKDLVATFNWDPFLAQAYQRNRFAAPLPRLAFLHGNVAFGYCPDHRRAGWMEDVCDTCGAAFQSTPLLYPVRDKDYTRDPFIENEWKVLRKHVESAYFLSIFGYSAPQTDAAARDAMMGVWQQNATRELAEVEIIDIKSEEELHESWKEFITRTHYVIENSLMRSYVCWHPRRSCDGLAAATLQNTPWKDDWLPEVDSLDELQAWIQPLIEEETELEGTSEWFSGRPCQELRDAEGGGE